MVLGMETGVLRRNWWVVFRSPRNVLRSPTTPSDMSVTCVFFNIEVYSRSMITFPINIPQSAYFDQGGVVSLCNQGRAGRRNQDHDLHMTSIIIFTRISICNRPGHRQRRDSDVDDIASHLGNTCFLIFL